MHRVYDEAERLEHAAPLILNKLAKLGRGALVLTATQRAGNPAATRRREGLLFPTPGQAEAIWLAAFTNATAVCWSSWSSVASAPALRSGWRGTTTTLTRTDAGTVSLGASAAEKVWVTSAERKGR
jgi:hypothetical protein